MNWTELLKAEAEATYASTERLMEMLEPSELEWKPATGSNWMTIAQVLKHNNTACGFCCRGFVTGDWGMPPDMKMEDMAPEDMLPPAEKMPAVESLEQAKAEFAADKKMAFDMIAGASEADLAGKIMAAPWNPKETMVLGRHLLHMIGHLQGHKAQLFYYLKLMGKPVNTMHLW